MESVGEMTGERVKKGNLQMKEKEQKRIHVRVVYGNKKLADCMTSIIRLHKEEK